MADEPAGRNLPPQNLEAERALLGCVLLDNTALDKVIDRIGPDDFYREAHRKIYRAILTLNERRDPFDLVTVSEVLTAEGTMNDVGGTAYVSSLIDEIPSAFNVESYALIVREKAILRKLISATSDILSGAYGPTEGIASYLDEAEQKIFAVTQARTLNPFVPMRDVVNAAFKRIEQMSASDEDFTGLTTGYAELDKLTAGLQPGSLIIIAGRPGMGKTSFALNVALNAAIRRKLPVIVFSLEMARDELAQRMLSAEARLPADKFRFPKRMEVEDWAPLSKACDKLSQAPVFVDDSAALNVLEMRGKARRLKHEQGGKLGLIVVDYLQLCRGHSRTDSREQEISEISRSLKGLAKELSVPIIALSQLNRQPEKRDSKKPNLSDLRESGSIEQDADIVIFIYRPEMYENIEENRGKAEIMIAKQRNGPAGVSIQLRFVAEYTRFEAVEEEHPSPAPVADAV